jgi:hypothetical protein
VLISSDIATISEALEWRNRNERLDSFSARWTV